MTPSHADPYRPRGKHRSKKPTHRCWAFLLPGRRSPLEILSLSIALFELRLDLKDNAKLTTRDVPAFREQLLQALPTLREHKCWSGETGGFIQEVDLGTDFAHVVEHVILELQHLADPRHRIYSGWTKPTPDPRTSGDRRMYTLHFQTRSFEIGSAASKRAVGIVSDLVRGHPPDTRGALDELGTFTW